MNESETIINCEPASFLTNAPTGLCDNCKKHPATLWWAGDGGMLAVSRGWVVPWCQRCALKAQLVNARESAARIPGLESELAALGGE